NPTIPPYRDSGDLISSSYTLGIAHPPGYPLYILLGKIFTFAVPAGNIAYRVNLTSIFFGALSAVLTGFLVYSFTSSALIALLCSFALSFSPAFWSLSHVSEMYTLGAFFAILLFILLYRVNLPKLLLCAFIFGLGLGSHPTVILLLPGILWFVFQNRKHFSLSQNRILSVFALFILGFTVYLFLPLRSSAQPVLDWGNPETLRNFWRVITRADYGGLKLHPEQSKFAWSPQSILAQCWLFIQALAQQFTWAGLLAGLIGIYYSFKRKTFSLLFPGFLFTGALFFILANLPIKEATTLPILEPNMVTPNLIFIIFIGYALSCITRPKQTIITAIALIIPIFLLLTYFNEHNRRNQFFAYDYGKNLLFTMDKDALIYDPDDATAFILSYMRLCENKRKDIKPVMYFKTRWGYEFLKKTYPEILPDRDIPSAQELINTIFSFNTGKRKIYTDVATKVPQNYPSFPEGLVYSIDDKNSPELFEKSEKLFDCYAYRGNYNSSLYNDFFTGRILYYYAAAHNNIGLQYSYQLSETGKNLAQEHYKEALYINPGMSESWNNMGTLAFAKKDYAKAIECFKFALKVKENDSPTIFNLGLAYKAAGDYANANSYFEKAGNNGYAPAKNELGLTAIDQGNYIRAIAIFQDLIQQYPNYSYAYYNLGLGYQKSGNKALAIQCYQKYLSFVTTTAEKKEIEELINKLREP
ncbi:MAG: hypothetical protein A3J83_00140, partial [Elusimicrobia bacterium RIFOXYA2_FULL_40_6]